MIVKTLDIEEVLDSIDLWQYTHEMPRKELELYGETEMIEMFKREVAFEFAKKFMENNTMYDIKTSENFDGKLITARVKVARLNKIWEYL